MYAIIMHVKGAQGSRVFIVQPFQAIVAITGKNIHFYGQVKLIFHDSDGLIWSKKSDRKY
jgi:hypothetical protein